jgi:hypothetical protein
MENFEYLLRMFYGQKIEKEEWNRQKRKDASSINAE